MMHETVTAAPAGARFTADRAPLLAALDYLARHIVERRNLIPILSNVRIEATPGALVISATDLDVEAAFTVPADVETVGTFTAPAASLRDVVKAAAKGARVSLRIDHNDRLIITSGRARNTLPTIGLKDWPVIACPRGKERFTVPAAQLATDLARVAPFMSKEETRFYLRGTLFELTADGLAIVALDGHNMSVVNRATPDGAGTDLAAILPSKTIDALQRALKAFPCETVTLSFGPGKVMIEGEAFGIVAKLIDGKFPDYRRVIPCGDELQATMDAESEPRIFSEALKAFTKAAGPVAVEMGKNAARLSIAGDDSWQGIMMLAAPGAVPKGYRYGSSPCRAEAYLVDFCARHDIALPDGERRVIHSNGIAQGMTVGTYHHDRKVRIESVIDWEALVERDVEIVEHEAGWQEGAFSVVMPRVREAVVSTHSVDVDGDLIPLAMNGHGTLYMTAKQVAAWCGPVDPSTHVAIAPRPMAKAWWKKSAPLLAPKPIANALQASATELAAYATACQAAADLHNARALAAPVVAMEAPAVAIDETPPPVAIAEAVAVEPVAVEAAAPLQAMPTDDNTDLRARLEKLESLVHELRAVGLREAPVASPPADNDTEQAPLPADPRARAVVALRDSRAAEMIDFSRAKRLRIVRRYLAMRRDRAALRALQTQHAIGQAQFNDVKARLAAAEQEIAWRDEKAEASGRVMERQLDIMQVELDQRRAEAARTLDVEQALLDARTRGDRMARVASRQRIGLARAAIDLRGARAETGAVRRQLVQALNPASAVLPAPSGTMAVAFAAACR